MPNRVPQVALLMVLLFPLAPNLKAEGPSETSNVFTQQVNILEFRHDVQNGDWSAAIQAAIDSVSTEHRFADGAEVYFPPGRYRIDRPIVLGRHEAHWGLRLIGYGATLEGSRRLDAYPWGDNMRELAQTLESAHRRTAAEDDYELGTPILELHEPPGREGAGYVIEGLAFDRTANNTGVGIKVPAHQVPKGSTFRSVKIFNQDIGVHINYAWQFTFENCIIRSNRIGLWGQNQFNAINIRDSSIRRNREHGLQVGPDQRQWGGSSLVVSGCTIEANGGYGLVSYSGVTQLVEGNHFEANGNGVGLYAPMGRTTLSANFFAGAVRPMPHPAVTDHDGEAHVVIARGRLRSVGNRYTTGDAENGRVPEAVLTIQGFDADRLQLEDANW